MMSGESGTTRDPNSASSRDGTLTEAHVAERDQRLLVISEIARILIAEQDTGVMLRKLLTCLVDTFRVAEAGVLFLYNPCSQRLAIQAAHGYGLVKVDQMRIASGEERCARALQTGRPQLYLTPETGAATTANLAPVNPETDTMATVNGREPRSCVCIPLISGEAKVGVLMLDDLHDGNGLAGADLTFWQTVADLIALSIETACQRDVSQSPSAPSEGDSLKAGLISTLAHDMRTPLASIKGYATALLMDEVTYEPETQREFLGFIDEECDTLLTLIYDLLESSVIDDAGLLRLEPQPVRLPHLVKSVTDEIARRTDRHRFLFDFPEHFPIVDADPDRIAQVLRNLLDNAVKYSPEGGLIVVRGEVRKDEVVVSVADQGVGLTMENLNRLFDKFFRAKPPFGRRVPGSGLGLPISRAIVESHGGRIWAESQLGQGTTLFFTLPLKGLSRDLGAEER